MNLSAVFCFPLVVVVCLSACGAENGTGLVGSQSESVVADRESIITIAKGFYQGHPDEYDMLVLWGGAGSGPAYSFYLPVKNDVEGIGYRHEGPEIFDYSSEFGSTRLEGIIWMGPSWMTKTGGDGPDSALGVLAHETLHRWGATVRFLDDSKDGESDELLGKPRHWSFFLGTGASPLGGNNWESLGGPIFFAAPVDNVEFSELDLYLMGLMPADEVATLRLLTNVCNEEGVPDSRYSQFALRTTEPVTVMADVREITIQSIIDAEGLRVPNAGLNAADIRQAWIYVAGATAGEVSAPEGLYDLKERWDGFFYRASGGRSKISADIF